MMRRFFVFVAIICVLLMVGVSAQTFGGGVQTVGFSGGRAAFGGSLNPQFSNPSFFSGSGFVHPSVYWAEFNQQSCNERHDILLQIAPGGCSPSVVRSDLLAEQNVPVFCKIAAIQVNPLIDLTRIRSLRFTGEFPPGVSGVSYYPAQAAIRSNTQLISSPVEDNLGYLVVVLSRNAVEDTLPEFVSGNITAVVDYDVTGAFGIGQRNFYLSEMSDEEWQRRYQEFGFWRGKGYVRAESITEQEVRLGIYRDAHTKQSTVTVAKNGISPDIYLGGFYCTAGLQVKVDSIAAPVDSALVQISHRGDSEQLWITRGDGILDGRCRVSDLDVYEGGGRIDVSCPVPDGKFTLRLNPGRATFNGVSYIIGSQVSPGVFLAYVGRDVNNQDYAVLVSDSLSTSDVGFLDRGLYGVIEAVARRGTSVNDITNDITQAVLRRYRETVKGTSSSTLSSLVSVEVVLIGSSGFGTRLDSTSIARNKQYSGVSARENLAFEYYNDALRTYTDLADVYPQERHIPNEDPYAAQGLFEAAALSDRFEMAENAHDIREQLVREYPDSAVAAQVVRDQALLVRYDTQDSHASVLLNNDLYFIDLIDVQKPSRNDARAVFSVDGVEVPLGIGEVYHAGDKSIQLQTLTVDSATVTYGGTLYDRYKGIAVGGESRVLSRARDQSSALFGDTTVRLLDIQLNQQANVRLIPKTFGPRTEASFPFAIGIEKRGIQLSPEKAQEKIDNLENTIDTWNAANEKLGNVVTGLKTACFATAGVLTAKNLLQGFSGAALARGVIMRSAGGWNDYCSQEALQKGISIDQCLREHSDLIDADVALYAEKVQETNAILEDIQKEIGVTRSDVFDFQGQVDRRKVENLFAQRFDEFLVTQEGTITLSDGTNLALSDMRNWETLTHEQRRELMTLLATRNVAASGSVLRSVATSELGETALAAKNYWDYQGSIAAATSESHQYDLGIQSTVPVGDPVQYADIKIISTSDQAHPSYRSFSVGDRVIRVAIPVKRDLGFTVFTAPSEIGGHEVLVSLQNSTTNVYTVGVHSKIVRADGTALSETVEAQVREYLSLARLDRVQQRNAKAYENAMLLDGVTVDYFERAPYTGLPSLVPFDVQNGWYVRLTYVLSGFGKPYDESGRAVNYWICNVGANGKIEFKQSADDICRLYNGQTGADVGFPGMSASESQQLITRAQQAIAAAAQQHGQKETIINGKSFKNGISLDGEEGQCSDFMSPQDCHIIFNVCDPVICPSSRCDLGGNYRVDNVVQTGIVGSLLMCLPNAQEGIIAPICLTGVHAGIDGYVSILNSAQACLEENLATGQTVGICDEIQSIYMCEFFWEQASPALNVFVPRLIELAFSQGVRGGGEYLTVQHAWDTTQKAVSFFTDHYAVNSLEAFNLRTTENVGSEICKNFISAQYPASEDVFDALVAPDSPVQYHAWFSEDTLTTATIPATSHYKVYYHIFSGNDFGAQYVVYLRGIPQSNVVHSRQTFVVDRGYVPRGQQVDIAKDFSAVSGYTQLCVSVNGQEECGFGKVSTSYLVNALSDQYAQSQIAQNIMTNTQCVAGTPSLYSFAQPNLQAGLESFVDPALYKAGIIRVCSTENPGKQVTASGAFDSTNSTFDQWKDVGYCDDPTIRCWLDTRSVQDVIKDISIEEAVLDQVDLGVIGVAEIWDEQQSRSVANEAEAAIAGLSLASLDTRVVIDQQLASLIEQLRLLSEIGYTNAYRAYGLYLRGKLYGTVAEKILLSTHSARGGQVDVTSPLDAVVAEEQLLASGITGPTGDSIVLADLRPDAQNRVIVYVNQNGVLQKTVLTVDYFDFATQQIFLPDGSSMIVYRNPSVKDQIVAEER